MSISDVEIIFDSLREYSKTLKDTVKKVLDKNEHICLDVEDEKEQLLNTLTEAIEAHVSVTEDGLTERRYQHSCDSIEFFASPSTEFPSHSFTLIGPPDDD